MPDNDLRRAIKITLQEFKNQPLRDASLTLLKILGYQSDKTIAVDKSDPEAFIELLAEHNTDITIDKDKALFDDWITADVLFQLTDEELAKEGVSLKTSTANIQLLRSYLFFAIELNQQDYARGRLIAIARQLNRIFPMPVMVLIKHGQFLSVSVINRRQNKIDSEKDVLGKATIIRDISLVEPHTGHIQILSEFVLQNLTEINSFDTLHAAWEKVLNVELLSKKFYNELSNWYFWAINEVSFPGEPTREGFFEETGSTDETKLKEAIQEHNAKNVIRLLTRFLFVWFIKEKQLIPGELFDVDYLQKEMLKDLSPYHEDGLFKSVNTQSHYYKAIIQNLFFATLNQEMGKRAFRRSGQNMNVTNLLRYENYFRKPDKFIELAEKFTPFMNGGLFECLDKPHPTKKGRKGGDVIIYEDGFSDRVDNPLKVPDYLFFGHDENVDLSDQYGSKAKKYKEAAVKGLINIFNGYKFTIAENTPIDQEIALDPELLGKVFENLLASYNPETKTTARKQTGSFYTPREIVTYMVDESLIAYLKNEVGGWEVGEEELDVKLHELFSYNDSNPFQSNQNLQKKIIQALDRCKILDPACGSGAFPMGILQKMVHILQKVDPDNTYWQELQMENAVKETESVFHLDDKEAREQKLIEINEAFDQQVNNPDYARKLFLIENCIYGMDIQPIATQISKLRFFISLVVEQKVDENKENFGIRPLPNLETKFVAANTLIGIGKHGKSMSFETPEIKKKEAELIEIRHRVFSAKTPKTKRKLKDEDKRIREEMGQLLITDGWGSETASKLVGWDPYDQNMSSAFFDPEWMFGVLDGFNIVIGNPPYIDSETMVKQSPVFREQLKKLYKSAKGNWDLFVVFIEQGISLTKEHGITSYIVPNKFISAKYTTALRELISKYQVQELIDYSSVKVFEGADVYPIVFRVQKTSKKKPVSTMVMETLLTPGSTLSVLPEIFYLDIFWDKYFFDENTVNSVVEISKYNSLGSYDFTILGAATVSEAYKIRERICELSSISGEYYKLINTGTIDPFENYWGRKNTQYIKGSFSKPVISKADLSAISTKREQQAKAAKLVVAGMTLNIESYFDKGGYLAGKSTTIIINKKPKLQALNILLNSKLLSFWFAINYSSLSMSGGYFNIGPKQLASLPVPTVVFDKYIFLLSNFNCIMEATLFSKTIFTVFMKIMNAVVFELYFPNHMQKKNIGVLQFIEEDFNEIILDRDFEKLRDNEKENIITRLHARWTHPDSEVRNRIKLFAVRSPNILKPILESR